MSTRSIEDLAEAIAENEEAREKLVDAIVKRMNVDEQTPEGEAAKSYRRDVLKALGVGGILGMGGGGAALGASSRRARAGSGQSGTQGTESNPNDYHAEDLFLENQTAGAIASSPSGYRTLGFEDGMLVPRDPNGNKAGADLAEVQAEQASTEEAPVAHYGGGVTAIPNETTHYPYAKGYTTDDVVNATLQPDHRNPLFGKDVWANTNIQDAHIMGAPHVYTHNGNTVVIGEGFIFGRAGEKSAMTVTDGDARRIGNHTRVPEFGSQAGSWTDDNSEVDPTPFYVPENQEWYLTFASDDSTDGWKTGIATSPDGYNWTVDNSVSPIFGTSHKAQVRVDDYMYVFYRDPGGTLFYKRAQVTDLPGGWSSAVDTGFSIPNSYPALLRCDDGWVMVYPATNGFDALEAATLPLEDFPDWSQATTHGTILSAGSTNGAWNEGGYRNTCWYVGENGPMLFAAGTLDGGTASDSTTGVFRVNRGNDPVLTETLGPYFTFDTYEKANGSFPETTSTSFTKFAQTNLPIDGTASHHVSAYFDYYIYNTGSATTYLRLQDVTNGQTLCQISSQGGRLQDQSDVLDLSGGDALPYSVEVELQMKVDGNTGGIDPSLSSGSFFVHPPGRFPF